jgi:hypothetical protein
MSDPVEIETIEVPKALLPLMVTYIKQASALADEVEGQATKSASDRASLETLAKAAATELAQSNLIERSNVDNAARNMLADPSMALKALIKVSKDVRPFHYGEAAQATAQSTPASTARADAERKFERDMGF